jgi:hypothetical protein
MCEGLDRFSNSKSEISNLIGMAVNISKQLHGWIESLKNSEIKGVKFYTEKEKARLARSKEDEEFDREMGDFKRRHEDWLIRRQADPNAVL